MSSCCGPGETGCCRQVAAMYSDHYRQVLLYMILLDQGRLAAVDRWLYDNYGNALPCMQPSNQ